MPDEQSTGRSAEDPPDGGYGWVVVGSVFFINGFTWGIVASYGVYLSYYLSEGKFAGATSVDYAFIGSLNFSMAMLMAPPATVIARHYGVKFPMTVGVFCLSGGFLSASFAKETWQLFLSQGVLVGIGVGLIWVPSIPVISQWFGKKRSLANGITSAGSGIGGLAMSFATEAIIRHIDLAWALRITAFVTFAVNMPATLLLRSRNAIIRPTQKAFDLKLLRRFDVFLFFGWGFIMMFGYITLLYSLSDYGKSIGLSDSKAAAQTAYINLGVAIGRPLIGIASDRFGRIQVAGLMTCLCGLICFAIWIPAKTFGVLTFFSIFSGGILGIFWGTVGPVATEVAGLKDLPSLLSLTWLVIVLPTTFSEVIALKLRRENTSHPYLYPQIFAGISYLVASSCLLGLYFVKRRQNLSIVKLPLQQWTTSEEKQNENELSEVQRERMNDHSQTA